MRYQPNPTHRNISTGKSQWSINKNEEKQSFNRSVQNGWILNDKGWGLHLPNGTPDWLSFAQDHITRVFIAKFVGNANHIWHGYPADYVNHAQDIPHQDIVFRWINANYFTGAKARKILRGQRCTL